MNYTQLEYWLINVLLVGLASFLGRVWSERIQRNEQANINERLETFKSQIVNSNDLFQNLVKESLNQNSIIEERRVQSINELWKTWLEVENVIGKFLFPYNILLKEEIQNDVDFQKVFPHTSQDVEKYINNLIDLYKDLEKHRIFIPSQIYQFFKIVTILLSRHAVQVQMGMPGTKQKRPVDWYLNYKGEKETHFNTLIEYLKENQISIPDTMAAQAWMLFFREHLNHLIHEYFDGSLDRNIKVFEKIDKIGFPSHG